MRKSMVLVFHNEENGPLFEKIIIALKSRYDLVSLPELEDLIRKKNSMHNVCHISFDDGVRSFYNEIFPLVKKHRVPVSLFVSPDIISSNSNYWFQDADGFDEEMIKNILAVQLNASKEKLDNFPAQSVLKCLPVNKIKNVIELYGQQTDSEKPAPQNMDIEQLKEVDVSGLVTIGAHTLNHPVLKNESDENCRFEITGSVKKLETLLGHPVKYFAYPNGRPGIDFGEREMDILRENGISLAFSTELDHLSAQTDLLSVPRMGFARMGLSPANPLVAFRLNCGKKWFDIRSIGRPSEREVRERVKSVLDL